MNLTVMNGQTTDNSNGDIAIDVPDIEAQPVYPDNVNNNNNNNKIHVKHKSLLSLGSVGHSILLKQLSRMKDSIWMNSLVDKHFLHSSYTKYDNILKIEGDTVTKIEMIEELQRLRNIVIILMATVILMTIAAIFLIIFGHLRRAVVGLVIYTCSFPILYALKCKPNLNSSLLGNITVGVMYIMALAFNMANGGVGQPSILVIVMIPSTALAVCEHKARQFWNVSIFVMLMLLFILHKSGFNFADQEVLQAETLITIYPLVFVWVLVCFYCHSNATSSHINQIKSILQALEIEKNEAEQARQDMANYISRMSHEFRSPLHVIMNLNELALTDISNIIYGIIIVDNDSFFSCI